MRNRLNILFFCALSMVATGFVSCSEDDLGPSIFDTKEYPLDRGNYSFPLDTFLKANFLEACSLAGIPASEPDSEAIEAVMEALVAKGLRRAIISLGKEGAFCYEVSGTGTRGVDAKVFPNLNVVSTNGCGDVLLAGFLRAMSEGFPMEDALWYGQAASGINAESMEAVSPELNFENVRKKVEEYYEQIS